MIWLLVFLLATCSAANNIYCDLADRNGDDYGAGSLIYPQHQSFAPFKGLCDLTHFQVSAGGEYFFVDLSFAQITNPWKAPEGFFHQHTLVFISIGTEGSSIYEPLDIKFNRPYKYVIRIAPWSLSSLRDATGKKLASISVSSIDEKTIRAYFPLNQIDPPQENWQYAVLVGCYDPFGADYFREITPQGGNWEFRGVQPWPFIDVLAASFGPNRQEQQISTGTFVFLSKNDLQRPFPFGWLVVGIAGLLIIFIKFRGFHFTWGLKLPRREHNKIGSIKRWG